MKTFIKILLLLLLSTSVFGAVIINPTIIGGSISGAKQIGNQVITGGTLAVPAAAGAFTGLQVGTGGLGNSGLIIGNHSSGTSAIWSTGVTPSTNNFSVSANNVSSIVNAPAGGTVYLRIANVTSPQITWNAATGLNITPSVRASGVASYFTLNIPADTGQTASTESVGFKEVTATRTWATTGTVALQRENFWAGATYASAAASQTFTDVFNSYYTPPIQGANAIFTRGHTMGIVDSTSAESSVTGGLIVATTLGTAATSVGIGGGNINAGGTIASAGLVNGTSTHLLASGTAPTINAGFGGTASIASSNGTATFQVLTGGTTGSTGVLNMPAATTGWNCQASLLWVTLNLNSWEEVSSTSTTVTFQNVTLSTGAALTAISAQNIIMNCAAY